MKMMKIVKMVLSIVVLFCWFFPSSFAQDLRLTNHNGIVYRTKPSLSQRISGVKEIYVYYPGTESPVVKDVIQPFNLYLRKLGLTVIDRGVEFERKEYSSGTTTAVAYLCNDEDVANYAGPNGVNQLVVIVNIVDAYDLYSGTRVSVTYNFVDPVNEFDWAVQFYAAKDSEQYINQCKSNICNWYSFNPSYAYQPEYISTNYTQDQLRSFLDKGEYSSIEGIYEGDDYTLGVKKGTDGIYYLLYHDSKIGAKGWKDGFVKAALRATNTSGVFRATWFGRYFQKLNYKIVFENGMLCTFDEENNKDLYFKMFPINNGGSENASGEWSGTGFAIKNGYVVTNYHVVDGAKSIKVYGIKGHMNLGLFANVVATDKTNDLAIIKISDSSFTGFGPIPYSIKNQTLDVGESVWVLGYPLTQYLGNEIKLTNGLISSKSGYQGDVATYQITAPIQPGNSGCPMFDSKGNIVGIVNAGVPGADNVGYAIKTTYLYNLADINSISSSLPTTNTIASLSLPEQVKRTKDYVFLLVCSSQ